MSNGANPDSDDEPPKAAVPNAPASSAGRSATSTSLTAAWTLAAGRSRSVFWWRLDMSGAQQLVDASDQRAFVRRLHDVVLGALAQPPCAVGFHCLGADDQHRNRAGGGVARQRARGLEAVHARQDDIHQDQ